MSTQVPVCHFAPTSLPVCQVTMPQHCLPVTLPAICNHHTLPPVCPPITTNPHLCPIQTAHPGCGNPCLGGTVVVTTTVTTTIQPNTVAQTIAHAPPAAPQGFAAVGPTGVYQCTATPQTCGNTAWQNCPPPANAEQVGQTGVYNCTTSPQTCGNTAWHPCPPAANAYLSGPTGVYQCTSTPQTCGNTAWQPCPPAPNTAPIGQTGVYQCTSTPQACGNTAWHACTGTAAAMPTTNPTAATLCFICPPLAAPQNQAVGVTGVLHCTATPASCGHTNWPGCGFVSVPPHCPTVAPHCPPQTATNTVAPTHIAGCTCLPFTVGPVITVAGTC